jgi:hypothetical protein
MTLNTTARTVSRNLLLAGLALVGSIGSIAATVSPAQAAAPRYTAKLVTALEAPAKKVVNDVIWSCAGDTCSAPIDGGRPLNTCIKVVKTFGQVTAFASPKGEFSAEDLQRCNAA